VEYCIYSIFANLPLREEREVALNYSNQKKLWENLKKQGINGLQTTRISLIFCTQFILIRDFAYGYGIKTSL
jgi:hypothetical protein